MGIVVGRLLEHLLGLETCLKSHLQFAYDILQTLLVARVFFFLVKELHNLGYQWLRH